MDLDLLWSRSWLGFRFGFLGSGLGLGWGLGRGFLRLRLGLWLLGLGLLLFLVLGWCLLSALLGSLSIFLLCLLLCLLWLGLLSLGLLFLWRLLLGWLLLGFHGSGRLAGSGDISNGGPLELVVLALLQGVNIVDGVTLLGLSAENDDLAANGRDGSIGALSWRRALNLRFLPGPVAAIWGENRDVIPSHERERVGHRAKVGGLVLFWNFSLHLWVGPWVLKLHFKWTSSDVNELNVPCLGILVQVIVRDDNHVLARHWHGVVDLIKAVHHVINLHIALDLVIRCVNHLNDEPVATGDALGVAGVLGLNQEWHIHAKETLGENTGAKGKAILRSSVGKLLEPDLVDGPSLSANAHSHINLHGTKLLIVWCGASDGVLIDKSTGNGDFVLTRAKPDLNLWRLPELQTRNLELGVSEHRSIV